MKVYTEVVWTWDEEKGELVEESSKSHEYEGPIAGALWPIKIKLDGTNFLREMESGWKMGWEKRRNNDLGDLGGLVWGTLGGVTGGVMGLLGQTSESNKKYTPGTTNKSLGDTLLKTQTAGTGSNFGRYGDISQQAPGGWIRQQNKNRDGRSSTLMTRGLSKKQINARHTA